MHDSPLKHLIQSGSSGEYILSEERTRARLVVLPAIAKNKFIFRDQTDVFPEGASELSANV